MFPVMLKGKNLKNRIYSRSVTAKENRDLCRDKDDKCTKMSVRTMGLCVIFLHSNFSSILLFYFSKINICQVSSSFTVWHFS